MAEALRRARRSLEQMREFGSEGYPIDRDTLSELDELIRKYESQ